MAESEEVERPELPETPKPEKWWQNARNSLITQILAILITPISIGVTIWFTDRYKAPEPSIEFVEPSRVVWVSGPRDTLISQINTNYLLSSAMREQLERTQSGEAIGWLNGHDAWSDKAAVQMNDAIFAVTGNLKGLQLQYTARQKGRIRDFMRMPADNMILLKKAFHLLDTLSAEIEKLKSTDREPTGRVSFTLGVLNKGASDGVVYDNAEIEVNGSHFTVHADNYTTVKAHSFEKIEFTSPYIDINDGSLEGVYNDDEKTVRPFIALVKARKEPIAFKIKINMSGKSATTESELPVNQ